MKKIVVIGIFLIISSVAVHAEIMYVTDSFEITLRSGQGTDHKIKKMLRSGLAVEVLKHGKDWTLIKTPDGSEGWVLTRFIQSEKTGVILFDELTGKYNRVLVQLASLKDENNRLKTENGKLGSGLASTKEMLAGVSKSYETLKVESADFLKLKEKYRKSTTSLEEVTEKADKMQKANIQKYIIAGLCGAGVLLFGFIIGFSTKSQRRRSSLL